MITSDGVLIDAPPDAAENALAFLDPITCTGSDRYVNECSHNVLSTAGECTKIAVSCRKFSSKYNYYYDPKCSLCSVYTTVSLFPT